MADSTLKRLSLRNLLTSAKAMVGSPMFRHIFVRDEAGREFDALEDGRLSCANVVSSLLTLYGLIDHPHATVATTLKKMADYGWQETTMAQSGAVVFWPEYEGNEHIGIVVGPGECISNSSKERAPIRHGMTLSNGVEATKFYVHPSLIDEK